MHATDSIDSRAAATAKNNKTIGRNGDRPNDRGLHFFINFMILCFETAAESDASSRGENKSLVNKIADFFSIAVRDCNSSEIDFPTAPFMSNLESRYFATLSDSFPKKFKRFALPDAEILLVKR